ERSEIDVQDVGRRRFEHNLKLMMLIESIRILAVSPILWPPRRLHIGGAPRLRTERAEKRRRVRRAGAHLHVVRLQERATLAAPVPLELENDLLERLHRVGRVRRRGGILRDHRTRLRACQNDAAAKTTARPTASQSASS